MSSLRRSLRAGFLLFLLGGALAGCTTGAESQSGSQGGGEPCALVSGTEARKLISEGALLVDVRSPEEFQADHLPGARNIVHTEVSAHLSELPKDKPIVVYCRSGRRSALAAEELRTRGYQVWDLGARSAWETSGSRCP